MRQPLYPFIAAMLTGLTACETPPAEQPRSDAQQAEATAEQLTKPLAYVNGQAVLERDVIASLIESDAGQVLSEVVLDRVIDQRLNERGLVVDDTVIAAERELVYATLDPDEDQAARLLEQFRRERGLGDVRFEAFLRRNAGLRMLVADRVNITPTGLRQEYELVYGPRYQPRIIVAATAAEASKLRQRVVEDGESFSDVATTSSTDISAAQGGLLSPISPADARYPQAVRDALTKLEVGQVSEVIAIDNGFALLELVRRVDARSVTIDDARDELEQSLRLRQERLLMQQLAREMIAEAKVVVLDPSLEDGWRFRKQLLLSEGQ